MNRLIPPTAVAAMAAVALIASPASAQTGPFENCTAAYAAGRSNIPLGDPAYAPHLDGTKSAQTPNEPDGIACENPPPGFKPAPVTPPAPAPKAPTTTKATTPTTKSKATTAVRATPRFTG